MKIKHFNIVFSQLLLVMLSFVFVIVFIENQNVFLITILSVFQLLLVEWFVLYLFSIADVLDGISDINKKITPKKIWYLLIPIFNTWIFHFYITIKICASIKNEFISRGIENKAEDHLLGYGITMCVTAFPGAAYLIYTLLNYSKVSEDMVTLSSINLILGLINLLFWFIYWNRLSKIALVLNAELEDSN